MMKSERRHELQTNYLADHLGSAVTTGRPYASYVIGGIVVALLAALAYGFYSAQTAKASAAAWGDYYFNIGSGDAEIFQQVAQDHAGTTAALWSKQAWADNKLLQGLDLIYIDRPAALDAIDKGIESYQDVLNRAYEPDLKNRAAMGLAQCYETIGKLDDATKYYKQVASGSQDGFANMANNRLAWITSGEGKSFYEWFATVKTSLPSVKPNIPADLSKPPTAPDIKFTEPPAMPVAPEAKSTPTEPPAGLPAAPATPAATEPATPTPTPTPTEPTTPAAPSTAAPTTTDAAPAAPATEPKASEPKATEPAAPAADQPPPPPK